MTNEDKEDLKLHYQNSTIIFTDHAIEKARKRFSLNKEAIVKLAKEAVSDGEFYIHSLIRHKDNQSYAFIFNNKVFVFGDGRDRYTGEHVTLFKTVYPHGKNTELPKNYKHFIKGKPIIATNTSKQARKESIARSVRKANKHKQF
jgi:hypothetical protein